MTSLGQMILAAADTYGDDIAYQVRRGFRRDRLTFREVGARARQVAGWLRSRQVMPGDRVVVWAPNMPEYAVLYFGAWLAGVVVVPIDIRTRQDVVDRFVAMAGSRLGFKSRYLDGAFGPPVAETIALEELFDLVAGLPPLDPLPDVGPERLCEVAFTSGTTGAPKGVMLTHGNLVAEIAALQVAFPLQRGYRALSLLPLSHALEQVITLLLAFTSGVRVTFVPRVNSTTIARALREDQITCLVLVPQLLRTLLSALERRARQEGKGRRWEVAHRLAGGLPFPLRRLLFREVHQALGGRLQFFGSGGAPLDVKLAQAWERMGVHVFEGYGLTETAAASTINTWSARRLGTVGRPVPGVEVRADASGELLIRGPTVTPGYFADPARTASAFADGWFRTGDVGYVDADGFVHISGREAFKIVLPDGRNVYPEDVEQALNLHPLVRESCVVGIEEEGGERVHAAILTDAPDRAGEIVRETNRSLAPHQQIRGYTVWAEEDFPRTPILKVDRARVRDAVQQRQARAAPSPVGAGEVAADPLVRLVGRLSPVAPGAIRDDLELEADLGFDSLGRVELLAAIEEDLGRVVDELRVGPQTTLGELRRLVAAGGPSSPPVRAAGWVRAGWARLLGRGLLGIAFRLQDHWMEIEVVHPERVAAIPFPSLMIFNYQASYAALVVLRALPPHLRRRVAVAVTARAFHGGDWWQGLLARLGVQAFPLARSGGAVRQSLEELGQWLDDGYAVLISPEGEPEPGEELLPFLGGTGLMAVEMRVPIVPFRLEGYHRLFPPDPPFPYLPNRRGKVRLIVGEPLYLPPGTSYEAATERARQAVLDTQ